jgi:hypothetical protein
MKNQSMRTVMVSLVAGFAVALTKLGAAVITGSSAMAAEASHSLADAANDLFLLVAQRRGARDRDDRHPLGYGREAYFWSLLAAVGVLVAGAAFSLRDGIDELIHPSVTSSFAVAYVVLAISTVFDLVSLRQSGGQIAALARRAIRVVTSPATQQVGLLIATTRQTPNASTSVPYMIPTTFVPGRVGRNFNCRICSTSPLSHPTPRRGVCSSRIWWQSRATRWRSSAWRSIKSPGLQYPRGSPPC